MKKMMTLLAALLFSTAAYSYCTVALQDSYTRSDVQRFTSYSCQEAQAQCKMAMARVRYPRPLHCRIVANNPIPPRPVPPVPVPPRTDVCEYSIVTHRGNGHILESFREFGRDACWFAQRKCDDALWERQRRGQNPGAVCERTDLRRPYPNPTPVVTRSCEVERRDRFNYLMQVHYGTATGTQGTGVGQRACDQAMSQCHALGHRYDSCTIRRRF